MMAQLTAFYAAHKLLCHTLFFLFLCFVDDKLPEDKAEYKLITKCIKKFGALLTEENIKNVNEKIEENIKRLDEKIDSNHEVYINRIDNVEKEIKKVDKNRREDSLASMRDRITQMYHYYLTKGYILEDDKKDFNALYERYVKNGGNSYVQEDIAPFMKALPRFLSHNDAQKFFEEHGDYNNGTENK